VLHHAIDSNESAPGLVVTSSVNAFHNLIGYSTYSTVWLCYDLRYFELPSNSDRPKDYTNRLDTTDARIIIRGKRIIDDYEVQKAGVHGVVVPRG
jgi:hypothetical protein